MRIHCLALLLLLAPLGCASTSPSTPTGANPDPFGSVPDDFSLDVTILTAEDEPEAHRRTARYVLFPDGSLHHDAVPGRGPNTLPAFTRRLDQTQLAELWSTVRTLGLADADGSDRIENFRRVNRPRSGHAYLIAVTGDGSYWNYTRAVPEGSTLDPALTSLLRELAAVSWAEDAFDDRRLTAPVRYDFGPDPWAIYRQNEEQ